MYDSESILREKFSKISNLILNCRDKFSVKIDDVIEKSEFDFDTIELLKFNKSILESLIFGSPVNTKKLDYNKDKKILEMLIMKHSNILISIRFLKTIIVVLDDFLESLNTEYTNVLQEFSSNDFLQYATHDENLEITQYLESVEAIIHSFSIKSTNIRESTSHLIYMVHNVMNRNPEILKLKIVTPDTLKRYYFKHVYDLKNSVKIFDRDKMIFGEINNIMRMYDEIIDYLFGEFVAMYHTLDTIFK